MFINKKNLIYRVFGRFDWKLDCIILLFLLLMLSAILVFIGTFTYNREKVSLDLKKKARLVFSFYSNGDHHYDYHHGMVTLFANVIFQISVSFNVL